MLVVLIECIRVYLYSENANLVPRSRSNDCSVSLSGSIQHMRFYANE